VTFSYTQIAQYLRCPRSYRYRYLDGWKEKDSRATVLFGRCFEQALGAYFRKEDSTAALFREWALYKDTPLAYSNGDNWERMLRQGVQLLERMAQHDRIEINRPSQNLQVKLVRSLLNGNDFVAYIDAIGKLDGSRCLLEWKTTTSRYPEEPDGLLALDPQLICYSWISRISDVALVAFVRKRFSEIQYFKTTITDEQREEFERMVDSTVRHIEAGEFLPHSGIRFPQNGCLSCPQLGCVSVTRSLWNRSSFVVPEPATLIGLTSFWINGRGFVEPKLNSKRAALVLSKIDEILSWEKKSDRERDTQFVELGRYLCEVRAGQYWRLENLRSFDEYLKSKFPESRRKAYYLMAIHEHLPRIPKSELKLMGWTKARELVKVVRNSRQDFDCAPWVHKAVGLPREEFKREVEKHLSGQDTEPWEIIYFKLYKSQLPVIEQAIETATLMLGNDKSRGYCLEMICADFLAGANLESPDHKPLRLALVRLFGLLSSLEQQEFLNSVAVNS
jgi:hypothetical protein